MKTEATPKPDNRVQRVAFPWLSVLAALLVIAYLTVYADPQLLGSWSLSADWLNPRVKWGLLSVAGLLLLRDLYNFQRQYRQQRRDLRRLREEVDQLWQDKKQLQLKAHTYSGHADKLKLFISDKLLDYIEYDEKFLHFKSIAAEVRHNGVISFDKVQTALQESLDAATEPDQPKLKSALAAMRYLWDLLDLSTADNLALHIGNLLCECEEHYCQRMLDVEASNPLPYEPVYSPRQAVWRALGLLGHEPLPEPSSQPHTESESESSSEAPDAETDDKDEDYVLKDSDWYVRLSPTGELLGNENHLVLLLENLLKNAQFFSSKRGYKSPFAPVALTLEERQGRACLSVYNRGPHIRDEDRQNLFQLGFTTRRAREQHGRGLGLYFVNEIVKGYEGRIQVRNIHTPAGRYTLRLEFENGEVRMELLDVTIHEGKPLCRLGNEPGQESWEWEFQSPLRSVEVTSSDGQESPETQRLADFEPKGKQERFDPANPARPQWRLRYRPKRNAHQLVFEPLDISGVEFDIQLPTARHRLDSSELELDEDIDAEVERLDQHFRSKVAQSM